MARLTEQEQQEIIRFLEADMPLPDKYRFLLFEDKREVELVWNGCCHVWTAPLGQGCRFSFGSRQGSVMCPAC
jgi:hypothetical protein